MLHNWHSKQVTKHNHIHLVHKHFAPNLSMTVVNTAVVDAWVPDNKSKGVIVKFLHLNVSSSVS